MDEMQIYELRLVTTLYWECIPRLAKSPGGVGRHWRSIANKVVSGQLSLANSGWAVMPKNEKANERNGEKPESEYFKIQAWVNVRLSDADKEEIANSQVDWPIIFAWMGERIYAGYRFSFSYDEYSKACQFSIICRADGDRNYGLAMSTRHPDVDMAFISLYYKDVALLENNWVANRPTPDAALWD